MGNYIHQEKVKELIPLLQHKKQIILQGPPGTGKTRTAKDLAEQIIFETISEDKKEQNKKLESSGQFELIQFHPSYSYEDFVRGISAKPLGNQIEYVAENRILAIIAKKALENLAQQQLPVQQISSRQWFENALTNFIDEVQLAIERNGEYEINETVFIPEIIPDAFRYTGRNADNGNPWVGNLRNMKFTDIIEGLVSDVQSRAEYKALENISGLAKQHASYYYKLIEKMRETLGAVPDFNGGARPPLKHYILIIDEINRANLAAVLGELIYALEYRGQGAKCIYPIENDPTIIIPENLYIIGTMNTADRSVGHIDYAIKRRFAFKNVLPNEEVITLPKAKELFQLVATLFEKEYLAPDFDKNDVQLGHSYFIAQDDTELKLKLEYEIVPILNEYVKDGLLMENAKDYIKSNIKAFGF